MGKVSRENTTDKNIDNFLNVNIEKSLLEIENSLRDNITFVLKDKYGKDWESHLGVSNERIEEWKNRITDEERRLNGKRLDPRLLYYSDFYDLKTIIIKNWDIFKQVFNDKKQLEYQLGTLESFRNPNAHHRELLSHQKHLAIGIVGELKLDILNYRGDKEKIESYFPSIDSLQINSDNFQNGHIIHLDKIYRIGDTLEIVVFASSPPNQDILYSFEYGNIKSDWIKENRFKIEINESHIGNASLFILIKSTLKYNKYNGRYDDSCIFSITVVPNINS